MRRLLTSLVAVSALAAGLATGPAAAADDGEWLHATSLVDKPRYPPDFAHFNYVNPDAPKGGVVRMSGSSPTFDTLNPILPKGVLADGTGLIYESLMMRALDEMDISGQYPQVAEAVRFPADYSSVTYRLNPAAKWHDGQPITPEDVVWSFDKLVELNPSQRFYYQHVTKAEVTGDHEVTFTFDQTGNRELPQIVGEFPDPAQALVGRHRHRTATSATSRAARWSRRSAPARTGSSRCHRGVRLPMSVFPTSGAPTSTPMWARTTSTRSATSISATST